jgi:hypothetical protein
MFDQNRNYFRQMSYSAPSCMRSKEKCSFCGECIVVFIDRLQYFGVS